MRVLHVVPAVAPRYGGPSEAALRLTSALREAGVETLLATTDADGRGRLPVSTHEELDYQGASVVFFPRLPGEALKASPALSWWLRRNVSRFDLVHVHSVFSAPSLSAGRAARSAGIPYIVRPLGQLDRWSLVQHSLRKRLFLSLGARAFVERATAIHWTDEAERSQAPEFAAHRRGFVVPLGVEEGLFGSTASSTDRAKVVLFLSRLHPKKNLEVLIKAFEVLGERAAGWRLVIAGAGDTSYVESLKRLAARGRASVDFVGWLSGEEKRKVLHEAALFVLPSRQENFGIAVAEAMASGTPVIVSEAVALWGEVRRAGAGWVTPLGMEGLCGVLAEAMSSPEERNIRGAAARRLAESRFRWVEVARRVIGEYEKLAPRGSKPS